jgi:SAM-dependent MidA family methyltransferase
VAQELLDRDRAAQPAIDCADDAAEAAARMLDKTAAVPSPDADALEHSARVVERVRAAIDANGGFLPFDAYMRIALYAPGLGYYVAGAAKLGAGGDFTTAPEMTPLFGAREIVELGGGSGRLAAGVLAALDARGAPPSRYAILEVSPPLRERQRATLARYADRVRWLEALPSTIDGAVIANEVLDAIPAHVVARRHGSWYERGVGWDAASQSLQWAERPLEDARLQRLAAKRFPPDGDYVSEVNPAAEALVEDVGRRIERGAALFIDYGFPAPEYYHAQRSEGTLMGHYRHRAHADPFLWPGLTDLTAHVDFSAMAQAGERSGLDVAGFAAQAPFLIGCGILDALARVGDPGSIEYLRAAAAVQKLLSPAEMGELFKVLALARGDIDWPGFSLADRTHRL